MMVVKHEQHHGPGQRDDHHEIHGRRDTTAERHLAATLASQLGREQYAIQIQKGDQDAADAGVRATASSLYRWLTGPVALRIHPGPVIDQDTGEIRHQHEGEHHVATVLTDSEKVTFTVAETDAKGNPTTADQIIWSLDDTTVGTITVSPDTMSVDFVAGVPGVANLTATDANDSTVTGVEAIQVTGGAATAITITAGPVSAQ